MAAFERLQRLGAEKFDKVMNLLMRGEKIIRIAREIQAQPPTGWGLLQDMGEKALMQQLFRLRVGIAEGSYGKRMARQIADGHQPHIRMLEKVSVRALDRMEELSELQRDRVLALVEKEKSSLIPLVSYSKGQATDKQLLNPQEYRHLLTQTNLVFSDYRQVLLDIQKMRFDLGLDEFKGPLPGMALKGATQTTTFPDGMSVQKQVFEAVATVERVFSARKIPQVQ